MYNLLISVATSGMYKSLYNVQLETYHDALVMERRIFDCSRWMICVWDGFAQPQSCIPYVHTGLSTHLYKRSLFSRESFDMRPRSQYMSRRFRFKCWRFVLICVRQVRRWSRFNIFGAHLFLSALILFNDLYSKFEGRAIYMNFVVSFVFLCTIKIFCLFFIQI